MTRTLSNELLAWHCTEEAGVLRDSRLDNRVAREGHDLAPVPVLSLVLGEPPRTVNDFTVAAARQDGPTSLVLDLESRSAPLDVRLSYDLAGAIRRKRAVIRNRGQESVLVLDVVMDDLDFRQPVEGGGQGEPAFFDGRIWAAIEHPAGWNERAGSRLTLTHHPGRRLGPGESLESKPSLVAVAGPGQARDGFVSWIQANCLRLRRGVVSVYTPFGINNQWGLAGTLDDEQVLYILQTLSTWRKKGVRFDYFTLDTGWVDYGSDLKRFRPVAFPEGPTPVVSGVEELGMKFGLWFATSWASQSCWDNPAAWGKHPFPPLTWRNGNPAMTDYAASFCLAEEPYFRMLKEAVLHHVRTNGARFLKFDGGSYSCSDPSHGHLPGRYATEMMHDMLIELSAAARAEAPDLFIMWYWGLRSPFWALHGDTIFESGLFMEGSGTSSFPTLHYRDSVTLAQDQNACHAALVPSLVKDSLGVWLADTRWGNYMGRERWREALVMDLGRGNLLFPNLWGDIHLLDDDDLAFLARMAGLARKHEKTLLCPRRVIGDPLRNDLYGYGYMDNAHGLFFLNNASFASRTIELPLGAELGLTARAGTRLRVESLFPEQRGIFADGGTAPQVGDTLTLWLRPFEVLMVEVTSAPRGVHLAPRRVGPEEAARLGISLPLRPLEAEPDLSVTFADAARFTEKGHAPATFTGETVLPESGSETAFLCVSVRLGRGTEEWKYSPAVAEIVQATARVGNERVLFVPVPDARQFGNTQKAGCSWVVYKTRMPRRWAGERLRLAVHAFLPPDVVASTEAWVVRRWWNESARPVGDAYYADAPS